MAQRNYLQGVICKCFSLFLSLLILGYHKKPVTGTCIELSPMSVALVCRVGDPLQLTCTTSVEFLEWHMRVINEQGGLHEITAFSNSRDVARQLTRMVVNDTSFTFMRTSARNDTPLVSTLAINSTSIDLNGTVVRCMDANNPMTSASTTIQIMDLDNNMHPLILDPNISQEFKDDNVTVTVEWIQKAYHRLNITVTVAPRPLVPLIEIGNASRQLTIPYNTEYNISLEGTDQCRPNVTVTAFILLDYANCGHPNELLSAINLSVPITIEDYDGLPIVGSTIRFECPTGLELVGDQSSAICSQNGLWDPWASDFTDLMCTNSSDSLNSNSNNIVLIGSVSAVIIVCIMATIILVAIVLCRKGLSEKRLSTTEYRDGEKSDAKHSSSHKVVYKKKSSLWIENNEQRPQEDLVYADVTVASKHKKKPANRPVVSTAQPDITVEYSAINFKLCNEKPAYNMENYPSHDDSLDVTLDKLLALLREEVGPRWYDFGEAVGIDEVVLDSIAKTTFPENCIVEVLDYWLKYFDDGTLTWSDVATALRDINLQELAYHIEQLYSVEADTSDLLQESVPSMVMPST